MAFTGPRVDLMLRHHLGGERWHGRGIGVVFNSAAIEAQIQDVESWVKAAIIHEISHAIAGGWALTRHLERDDYSKERVDELTADVAEFASKVSWWSDDEGDVSAGEFLAHDDRWIRCVIHLSFRASIFRPEM